MLHNLSQATVKFFYVFNTKLLAIPACSVLVLTLALKFNLCYLCILILYKLHIFRMHS